MRDDVSDKGTGDSNNGVGRGVCNDEDKMRGDGDENEGGGDNNDDGEDEEGHSEDDNSKCETVDERSEDKAGEGLDESA